MPDGLVRVFQKLLVYWDFHTQPSLGFTKNGLKTCLTFRQMGYSSRIPHWVPFLSAKNRKRRLQLAQAHQYQTTENWKNIACCEESQFQLWHSGGRVKFGVNNMKAWTHPAFYQQLRMVVERRGGYFLVTLWVQWPLQSPDLNRASLRCGGTEESLHGQISGSCVRLPCQYGQYLWGMFPTPWWIYATKN